MLYSVQGTSDINGKGGFGKIGFKVVGATYASTICPKGCGECACWEG